MFFHSPAASAPCGTTDDNCARARRRTLLGGIFGAQVREAYKRDSRCYAARTKVAVSPGSADKPPERFVSGIASWRVNASLDTVPTSDGLLAQR